MDFVKAAKEMGLALTGRVGTKGGGDLQFNNPCGVSVDHVLNRIRAADSNNSRIVVMTLHLVFIHNLYGSGEGKLEDPMGITAAPGSGILYITDFRKHCVVVMNENDGTVLRVFGEKGSEPGQLDEPWGIALSEGHLYVADCNNHRVQMFKTDGTSVACYGCGYGRKRDQFKYPKGLTISGVILLVADSYNYRIQRLSKTNGRFLGSFCTEGSGEGQLNVPYDVAAVGGMIYIADYNSHRVVVLDHEGKHIGTFGSKGDRDGQFVHPKGIGTSGPVLAVSSSIRRGDHQCVTVYKDVQLVRGAKALKQHLTSRISWMLGQDSVLAKLVSEFIGHEGFRPWTMQKEELW